MVHVQEVNDPAELPSLRLLWNSLLPKTRGATFFQSLDWLLVYLKHFGANQRLRVLVVSRDGQPIGILPLIVRVERSRVGTVRVLTYPLHDWGTFYGPIGPNPTATLTAGLRHIRQTPRDFDLLDLRWVDVNGHDRGRTNTAMRQTGLRPHRQGWDQASVIDMQGDWETYWRGRGKKWRHNVNRYGRRLAEQGEVTFVRYRPKGAAEGDGDPRWDLYDACVELAQQSWQGSSTDGTTLSDASVAEFLRDTHAAAARAGAVEINLLLLDGRPIAFVYNYHYQGRVYSLRKGYDPGFAAFGPGLVLDRMIYEDSFGRGDVFYDLGVGSQESKRHWATDTATSYRFTHFPAAAGRAQLLRLKRWVLNRLYGEEYVACRQTA